MNHRSQSKMPNIQYHRNLPTSLDDILTGKVSVSTPKDISLLSMTTGELTPSIRMSHPHNRKLIKITIDQSELDKSLHTENQIKNTIDTKENTKNTKFIDNNQIKCNMSIDQNKSSNFIGILSEDKDQNIKSDVPEQKFENLEVLDEVSKYKNYQSNSRSNILLIPEYSSSILFMPEYMKPIENFNRPNSMKQVSMIANNDRYKFHPEVWIDCDNYWLNTAQQGSDKFELNYINRLNSDNIALAIDMGEYPITRNDLVANIISGKYTNIDNETNKELEAHIWFRMNRKIITGTVGYIVPKWEPRIGALIHGFIDDDGMIKIKTPDEMYTSLIDHIQKIKSGWRPSDSYHCHLKESHYIDIQSSMKIADKKWCEYIVYAHKSNLVYIERIHFNQQYWQEIISRKLNDFLNKFLEPLIIKSQ